jgi:hypothetical protein
VQVVAGSGVTEPARRAVFKIDSVEEVAKDHFPTLKVYGDLPYAGIRLVTCGGRFNQATGHYVDNIVAYGHLVRANP